MRSPGLKSGLLGGAAGDHAVDPWRRDLAAIKREDRSENDDGQNEIGHRTGGDDDRARANALGGEGARRSSSRMHSTAARSVWLASFSSPRNFT